MDISAVQLRLCGDDNSTIRTCKFAVHAAIFATETALSWHSTAGPHMHRRLIVKLRHFYLTQSRLQDADQHVGLFVWQAC